jgi:hypothetical protein
MARWKRKSRFAGIALVWLATASFSFAAIGLAAAEDVPAPGARAATPAPAAAANVKPAPAATPMPILPAQPPSPEQPGLLHAVGRWWHDAFGDWGAKFDSAKQNPIAKDAADVTGEAIKNAASATKDAATAIVRLPGTRVIEVSEPCAVAGNGAPDCQVAANGACRKKGFNSGQPIDVRTSQECPAAVLLSGKPPAEGECPNESVVLRVICQ